MNTTELKKANISVDSFTPAPGDMTLDPKSFAQLNISSACFGAPAMKATICDPELRTLNTQAKCGSPEDIYYYSPWRAPGFAPVIDPCGSAGGRFPHQPRCPGKYPNESMGWNCGAGANFQNFSKANRTDFGSKVLAPMESQATWKAGSVVEVGWTVEVRYSIF